MNRGNEITGVAIIAGGMKGKPMRLSTNFTLEELCITNTGAVNIPNAEQTDKLLYLASYILQPIRDAFGVVTINSGFRSEFVNEKIGGAKTSQHMEGEAADIETVDLDKTFEWCRKNLIFGQLILENKNGKRWIHISLPRIGGMNMQVLTFDGFIYKPV